MTHTYAVVIEPAGLCGRCLQQLGGDGERVRGVGDQPGGQVVRALEVEQGHSCGSCSQRFKYASSRGQG